MKHKLEQVASFGCEAFAILFDDIDVELCDADKSLYQSFASAQACDVLQCIVYTSSVILMYDFLSC